MSELTKELLEEYARDGRNAGDVEVKQMARELLSLLALRDAGDDEVELIAGDLIDIIYEMKRAKSLAQQLRLVAITRGQTRTDAVNKAAEWAKECEGLQEQLREAREENTRLEQDLARLKVEYADLESRFDSINKACDIFEKNSKAAADLCDENWKLKADIERLKGESQKNFMAFTQSAMTSGVKEEFSDQEIQSLQSQIATLTAERDEARKEGLWVRKKLDLPEDCEFTKLCGSMHVVCSHAHGYVTYIKTYKCEDKDGQIARLTVEKMEIQAELATIKSAPGMEEVDALSGDFTVEECDQPCLTTWMQRNKKLADLARRSIASREEVVGKLDQMESDIRDVFSDDWNLLDELKTLSRCDTLQPYAAAHRLLAIACCPEIVEGK